APAPQAQAPGHGAMPRIDRVSSQRDRSASAQAIRPRMRCCAVATLDLVALDSGAASRTLDATTGLVHAAVDTVSHDHEGHPRVGPHVDTGRVREPLGAR